MRHYGDVRYLLECTNSNWCKAFERGCFMNCDRYSFKELIEDKNQQKQQKDSKFETISESSYKSLSKLHERLKRHENDRWFWEVW